MLAALSRSLTIVSSENSFCGLPGDFCCSLELYVELNETISHGIAAAVLMELCLTVAFIEHIDHVPE